MAIVKIKKKENPFVQIDKTGIISGKLSWKATGLLIYLISLLDNWEINISHLSGIKTDGIEATKSCLNELREQNYCHYFEIRESGRVVDTTYIVFEIPTICDLELEENIKLSLNIKENQKLYYKKPKIKEDEKRLENTDVSPKVEKPLSVKPLTGNPTLIIKNDNNNKINNKNHDSEMIFFEELFKKLNIDFSYKNQCSIKRLLKKMTFDEVVDYLKETYNALKSNPKILNVAGAFVNKIEKGERQVINQSLKDKEKTIEMEKKIDKKDFEEKDRDSISIKTLLEIAMKSTVMIKKEKEEIIYTVEEEENAIKNLLKQGLDKNIIKKMNKTMYVSMIKLKVEELKAEIK